MARMTAGHETLKSLWPISIMTTACDGAREGPDAVKRRERIPLDTGPVCSQPGSIQGWEEYIVESR